MNIFDISRRLEQATPTWPGDTPFSYEVSWPKEESGSVNVGKVVMSTHTGTHVDAPFHFDNEGKRIGDLDLSIYIGLARVVDMSGKMSIGKTDLEHVDLEGVKRLLLYTGSWEDSSTFPTVIPHICEDVAPFLAAKGVILLGVDVPSVDPLDSKELLAHHALHQQGIHILESVNLAGIYAGDYELIALPLPLVEGDGSPVRAVLRSLKGVKE